MLIRYPGSKDQHIKFLLRHLTPLAETHHKMIEPFSGTASVTFSLLKKQMLKEYWINDLDPSVISLWKVVKDRPEELISLIEKYTPNTIDFYEFKVNPGEDDLTRAFRKVVLHQVSYSGLGPMAGGPLGGKKQAGKYLIDCRWRPVKLKKNILECSKLLNSVPGKFTSKSYASILEEAFNAGFFAYLDPPYYVAGKQLYTHGQLDHQHLSDILRQSPARWILSYDNDPAISELYQWADVQPLAVRSHLHHRAISDVVILPLEQEGGNSYAW